MLVVCCVLRTGGLYGLDYVLNLKAAVSRHLTLPHRFVCLTDLEASEPGIRFVPLRRSLHGWWSKLELFDPAFQQQGERLLYFDLDTVILGQLDEIASYDGKACVLTDFDTGVGTNSSMMAWASGAFRACWDAFWEKPGWWVAEGDKCLSADCGDQMLLNHVYGGEHRFQDLYPKQIVSYRVDCDAETFPGEARVVCLQGFPKPAEFKGGWVAENWDRAYSAPNRKRST